MANLVVVLYDDQYRAKEVMKELKTLKENKQLEIDDAAYVTKDDEGHFHVHQEHSVTKSGAVAGGLGGIAAGLLFTIPIAGLAVGAAAGAFAGKKSDIGIDDKVIKAINDDMRLNTSAIFLLAPIRHVRATEAAATTVFWFGASSLVPLGLAMLVVGKAHSAEVFGVLAIMAVAGGAAQLFLTGALRLAPFALVMPMDYLSLIWSSLLGFFIFSQLPSHWTLIGAPLVIAAGLVILWREQRLNRRAGAELVELAD